jgi:predicted ATPase
MSKLRCDTAIHLPNLKIRGFFGIEELEIKRLGPVTLIAGANGAGKTTVLDAVRTYAERGRQSTLQDILNRRQEILDDIDVNDKPVALLDWSALFFGRCLDEGQSISIGPPSRAADRQLLLTLKRDQQTQEMYPSTYQQDTPLLLETEFAGHTGSIPIEPSLSPPLHWTTAQLRQLERQRSHRTPDPEVCQSLGPDLPDGRLIADLWQAVALRDAETDAIDALNLLTTNGQMVERVTVIESERGIFPRPIVRLSGRDEPVPLKSLGDGALRMFCMALALANSRGGFLLIDEVENGIHHSVQDQFWEMISRTAHANNVQVLATTHSWDAVAGYARAMTQIDEIEGALVRLERDADGAYAVEYSEEDLEVAAEQGIEVR